MQQGTALDWSRIRRHSRLPVRFGVWITTMEPVAGLCALRQEEATNVSRGGMCIISDEGLELGCRLFVEFSVVHGRDFGAISQVVWLSRGADGRYELGLQFLEFVDQSKSLLTTRLGELLDPREATN